MRRYLLPMLAAILVFDAAPTHAATKSCPASLDMATGQVSIPPDWLMSPNFFPPNPLQLPLYSTSFGTYTSPSGTTAEFDCMYQAGPKLLSIWQKIPTTCSKGPGAWYEGASSTSHGWTCYGPPQSCTFECD
jgi:hypothetical protein